MRTTLIIVFILLGVQMTTAQVSDFELIEKQSAEVDKHKVYPNNKNQKFYIKYNPVYLVLKGGLRLYKKNISPQLATKCIYEESCSHFSNTAIETYGVVKGFFLTCDRLTRCNKMSYAEVSQNRKNRIGKVLDPIESYSFKSK